MAPNCDAVNGTNEFTNRVLPDCWGHRGASARFPENTLASFEAAIRDGAEGIESDVHVSADNVVLMFHDPVLKRTTGSEGRIKERNWYGGDGMQHLRTIQEPAQPIPTFAETVALLMKPENSHVRFNVDVKVHNDPERLFQLMSEIITTQPSWETALAPRILLGIWHPKFLQPAKKLLAYCRRSYIGVSTYLARKYFWKDCDGFSVFFGSLTSIDGQRFREECKSAGKFLMVWTVNDPAQMMEAVRWGVNGIITDVTNTWLDLRAALQKDYEKIGSRYGRRFLWTSPQFYSPMLLLRETLFRRYFESVAGPFEGFTGADYNDKGTLVPRRRRALSLPSWR